MKISLNNEDYELEPFATEQELEDAVQIHSSQIFSDKCIYICIKKRITNKTNLMHML